MAQTKTEIQAILAGAGIAPLRRYGQHFLIDGNLMGRLVTAAAIRPDDVVLEVGPGTGALTERLLETAGQVVAVEIDRGLHAICRERFADSRQLTLIHTDVLASKGEVAPEVLAALDEHHCRLGGRVMLVANLPYQIATPLLIDLLTGNMPVSPLCFTVQAEVADRIAAAPGGAEYGPVSVIVQALGKVQRIARVPPQAFWPVPKVDSAMLRVDGRPDAIGGAPRRRLLALVHGSFQHRRKTMRSNLKELLEPEMLERVVAAGQWRLDDRPERWCVDEWVAVYHFVEAIQA